MKYSYLLILFFLIIWITLGLRLSQSESPTFDEPVHLKAGALYTKGDYDFDPIEPPLLRHFAYKVGNQSRQYRLVIIALTGLFLSILIWRLVKTSLFSGILASVLFLTEANLVAHSHYVTTDAVSAIISVIASLLLLSSAPFLTTVFFVALSASLKVATLALLGPVLLIKAKQLGIKRLLLMFLLVSFFIWSTYGFRFQNILTSGSLVLPLGGYLRAVKENVLFAQRGQPIFFNGQITTHASALKTPLTILFKTSLPILILSVWMTWGVIQSRTKNYWLIFIIILLVSLFKPLNFGIRHLLPAEIALVLVASQFKPRTIVSWTILIMLLVWQAAGFIKSLPQPITFTNELAGNKPYQIFSDSDYDWGQGLIQLNKEIKKREIKSFQLAYFGNVDPKNYLPGFTRIKDENPAGSQPTKPVNYEETIIISVTCYYQCGYHLDPVLKNRNPQLIAKSFLYFP